MIWIWGREREVRPRTERWGFRKTMGREREGERKVERYTYTRNSRGGNGGRLGVEGRGGGEEEIRKEKE